jgi:hypothetical protein
MIIYYNSHRKKPDYITLEGIEHAQKVIEFVSRVGADFRPETLEEINLLRRCDLPEWVQQALDYYEILLTESVNSD